MSATLDGDSSSRALLAELPDWKEMALWQRWLHPGDIFVDVGANVGLYSLLAARRGATVLAFEPDPLSAARLRSNVALNGFGQLVQVYVCAVGSTTGWASLSGSDRNRMHLADHGDVKVRVEPLDDVLGPEAVVRGIKVDVEGYESDVLAGTSALLAAGRAGLVQLEWNDLSWKVRGVGREDCYEQLASAGYVVFRLRNGAIETYTECPPTGDEDIFAVPSADIVSAERAWRDAYHSVLEGD